MSPPEEQALSIRTETDIVLARRAVREAAHALGFGITDTTRIVTAASELARNIFKYAGEGRMLLRALARPDATGIELQFEDGGPGIPSIPQALEPGYSTSGGFGMGLPGAKRLMDAMEIQSAVGKGTTVTIRKWRKL